MCDTNPEKQPSLKVIPLGGLGEIGLNIMVFEYDKDIMLVDADGQSLDGRKPSAETGLHTALYRRCPAAGAVLHQNAQLIDAGRGAAPLTSSLRLAALAHALHDRDLPGETP